MGMAEGVILSKFTLKVMLNSGLSVFSTQGFINLTGSPIYM